MGVLLQPLAVFGQAFRIFADRTLGRRETLRQRAIEALASLLTLHSIEAGPDAFGQVQTKNLTSEQLSDALLFSFILAALHQRRALLAEQMDTGKFEQW